MARSTEPLGLAAFRPAFRDGAGEPDWLQAYRRAGAEQFAAVGLPTNREEAWKYTSLRPLARAKYQPAPANDATQITAPTPLLDGAAQAVFVNGRFAPTLSDLSGLGAAVMSWNDASQSDWLADVITQAEASKSPLYALNAASFDDGLAIKLGAGEALPRPLEIVHLASPGDTPSMWHPRLVVDIGDDARATLVERHLATGEGSYLANHAVDIRLGDRATLTYAKLQAEGLDGRHIAMTRVRIGANSLFDNFVLTTGAGLSRNEIAARIEGADAELRLNGAYSIDGRQHADHTSRIDHLAERTTSKQVYAGAIDGNGRGVFQGHIVVDRAAQKTDGHQMNRALMLSDHAGIDAKPILEIYADDVKCSHGATTGDIDDDQLFYLRARGIPAKAARRLVVRGFLADAAEGLGDEAVRSVVLSALDAALGLEDEL